MIIPSLLFSAAWISMPFIMQYKNDHPNYPENGYYSVPYNGGTLCAKDSPWVKNEGGSEYFYITKEYDGFLICKLWIGTPDDIENFNDGRAFETFNEAEQKTGKKFETHSSAGNYMREIK